MTEDKEDDKFFADLDALTEQQIEVGSPCYFDSEGRRCRPAATETCGAFKPQLRPVTLPTGRASLKDRSPLNGF
jgi:hypothetical protein